MISRRRQPARLLDDAGERAIDASGANAIDAVNG